MGMVVLILTGLALAFVGGDPTGPAGPVAAGVVALIGIGMAVAAEERLPQWTRFAGRSRLLRPKQSEP